MNFYENVLLVLSVPADYSKKELAIMRKCAYKADLTNEENSEYLQFTTEREYMFIELYYIQWFLIFFFNLISRSCGGLLHGNHFEGTRSGY